MKIDCVADLHGELPRLPGGDILIIAGDVQGSDDERYLKDFSTWLHGLDYDLKVMVFGNHDTFFEEHCKVSKYLFIPRVNVLSDDCIEYAGLKIGGSPWTRKFKGMNPRCMAFTCNTEQELYEKWKNIPLNLDILVTHSPPYLTADMTRLGQHVGSISLLDYSENFGNLKLWVCGHIHEGYGKYKMKNGATLVNASIMNEFYEPINEYIRVEL